MDLRLSPLKNLIHPNKFWIYNYSYNVVLEYEFTNKITPLIDFTDEPVIQCDIPIAKNTFAGNSKLMIKMENNRNKLLLINFDVNTFIYCLETNFMQF